MKTLNLLLIGIFLISLISLTSAQSITQQDIDKAGITPDSSLYPVEIAFEKITELFSENAKLQHAQERLAEVKVMISENKLKESEKAINNFKEVELKIKNKSKIKEHSKVINELDDKIKEIEKEDEEELKNNPNTNITQIKEKHKKELENVLEEHNNEVENEKNDIEIEHSEIKNKENKINENNKDKHENSDKTDKNTQNTV